MRSRLKSTKILVVFIALAVFVGWSYSTSATGESGITRVEILPGDLVLRGPTTEHRLVVEVTAAEGTNRDVTSEARFRSADPGVAEVNESGVVRAVSSGQTSIIADVQGNQHAVVVKVIHPGTPAAWSFRNHVIPVLTRSGCNSGACHGAAAGKNGFKLTLRGYDPELDHVALTRQAAGRRINKLEPSRSLVLLKPTLSIPHGGGKRFDVGSLEYNVLAQWIASGMQPPSESDATIQRLEVLPDSAKLSLGAGQQLIVRAHFSDGNVEDVTKWAKYSSTDDSVATVDEQGRVKMQGQGEAAISVWYLSRVSLARVSAPFSNKVDSAVYDAARRSNFIDELVIRKLRQLNIAPAGSCTDTEFIRRVYLDTAGVLPTAEEVEKFLTDKSRDKRSRLVDALLERSEFVDYWSYKWSDLLLVSSGKLSAKNTRAYYNWIRASVAANKPWDRFVRELTTASGNSHESGAVNYYLIHRNPIDLAENYTKAFTGLSITCARCHNHPLEKWTQTDYYGFANLFARVSLKSGSTSGETVFSSSAGEINHPRLGRPLAPRSLDGAPMTVDSGEDRREYLARWATSPENLYFARAVVNRVWANFFGRGLVHPVDDLRATNPASNEELFEAVTKDFVARGFDIKRLIKTILNSATYQLSSETNEANVKDDRYYSHYIVRRLPAEVILDALSQVTGVPERFTGFPVGTRAMQLPDTRVESHFLTVFGRPERINTSAAERQEDPNLAQALHIINGETLNRKLMAVGGALDSLLKLGMSNRSIVDHLYLSAYSRYPSAEEREKILAATEGENGEARRRVFEDLAWAIFTSKEFLFNH